MSFYYFPGDFVYWENVSDHTDYKEKFLPEITKMLKNVDGNKPFDSSEFSTGFGRVHYNAFLMDDKFINDVIFKAIVNMTIAHNKKGVFPITFTQLYVKDIWWNHYETGNYQEPHTHPGPEERNGSKTFTAAFSLIYVLKDENKDSRIIFHGNRLLPFYGENVNFDTSKLTASEMEDVNKQMQMDNMGEGTVIVFPSTLTHMVKPSLKPGRVTVAVNVYADIKI